MEERKIENLKVFFRERPVLYKITKIIYYPVRLKDKAKKKIKTHKAAKKLLIQLNCIEKENKKLFYFGVPTHENLGDAAQLYCIRDWIKRNYAEYQLFEIESLPVYNKRVQERLEKVIRPTDIIITESGATFSNRHEDHKVHRYLLEKYKNNRILMMPETVDFSSEEELMITAKLFNEHSKAFLLARDRVSYNMLASCFDNTRIALYPDIVTTMIGNCKLRNVKRKGILICKRIDGEKQYTDNDLKEFYKQIRSLDSRVDMTDTNFHQTYEYTMQHLEEVLKEKLNLFADYQLVITDRFHGMIFSLISNTPVIVLPTKGHKVREGANWFKKYYPEAIWFCENLMDAETLAKDILKRETLVENCSVFQELYYDKLKKLFENTTEQMDKDDKK